MYSSKAMIKSIIKFFKRLFWAIAVAYMVAWHNVYKEEDKILYQVVTTLDEDEQDDMSSPDGPEANKL